MAQQLAGVFLSAIPVSPAYTFGNVHIGAGSYSKHEEGLGVGYETANQNSLYLCDEATWRLRYRMLAPIPTGTPKMVLVGLLAENSKVAKVRVKWACVPMGNNPSATALNDEGVTTVTWGASDSDKYVEAKIALDAAAMTDGSMLVVDLNFVNSYGGAGWTATKTITWLLPMIVSEQ